MDTDTKTIISIIDNKDNLRSKELLASFVRYCLENEELRFWQALRNWCGWGFVLVAEYKRHLGQYSNPYEEKTIVDTFYWEKNHAPFERNTGSKSDN